MAFDHMAVDHKSSIGIVDDNGKLIGTLSVSCLGGRGIRGAMGQQGLRGSTTTGADWNPVGELEAGGSPR